MELQEKINKRIEELDKELNAIDDTLEDIVLTPFEEEDMLNHRSIVFFCIQELKQLLN